jgi:hypothetical protein
MTEPELIWLLATAVDWNTFDLGVYQAVVDYMGADALEVDTWDEAEALMTEHWRRPLGISDD